MNLLQKLYLNLIVFNIIDKILTYIALNNPRIYEVNRIIIYLIDRVGIIYAMIIYALLSFILITVAYKILSIKKDIFIKNNIFPESIFLGLNIIFCFVIINNLYRIVKT
jgi:hypothetical protein